MNKIYGEFTGVKDLYRAPITQDDALGYVVGTPEFLAPAAEVAGTPVTNRVTTYYDNRIGENYDSEGPTDLLLTVSGIPAETLAEILGKYYEVSSGRVIDVGEVNPPRYALGFRVNIGKSDWRYFWFLNGMFSGGAEVASSRKESVDPKTYQLSFKASPTEYEFTVNSEAKGVKRIFGDTTDDAFVATGWFSQVQTPLTSGAPSAVALSSILPDDGATNQLATVNVVLTFNNEIASNDITLIKADGTLVAGAKTWDVTGKICTINPTDALTAGATYIVAVNGVVDVYGQALTAVAKDFTVES